MTSSNLSGNESKHVDHSLSGCLVSLTGREQIFGETVAQHMRKYPFL